MSRGFESAACVSDANLEEVKFGPAFIGFQRGFPRFVLGFLG